MSTNNIALQIANADARDQNIRFYARGHKYEIVTDIRSKYTSVTTWNKSHFPKFDADAVIANIMRGKNWNPDNKYWGQTPEQIKASWFSNGASVADAGTNLHEQIEEFIKKELVPVKLLIKAFSPIILLKLPVLQEKFTIRYIFIHLFIHTSIFLL